MHIFMSKRPDTVSGPDPVDYRYSGSGSGSDLARMFPGVHYRYTSQSIDLSEFRKKMQVLTWCSDRQLCKHLE
jgi:hypothetical protein